MLSTAVLDAAEANLEERRRGFVAPDTAEASALLGIVASDTVAVSLRGMPRGGRDVSRARSLRARMIAMAGFLQSRSAALRFYS